MVDVVWAGRPRRLSRDRLSQVAAFLETHGGTGLRADQLHRRLRKLRALMLLHDDDLLIGTLALKPVNLRHQRRSFRNAEAPLRPRRRRRELGFLCIDPAYRNQGLAFRMMQEARDRGWCPTYSITGREGVRKMHAALGMVQHGTPWAGRKGELTLWTWDEDAEIDLAASGES